MDEQPLKAQLEELVNSISSQGMPVSALVATLGREGLLLLVVFLSLPFLLPVSIPGVSTVFGSLILLIGIAELLNLPLWLPNKVGQYQLTEPRLREILRFGSTWVDRLERVSKPRLHRLSEPLMARVSALVLVIAAALLMLPLALIPFSNTLPALACITLALGLVNRDGLMIVAGWLFTIISAVYFALIFIFGSMAILEGFKRLT